ncbi:hypothetical protein [Geodermatophilus ruber]|uniref:Uncharacterized protein n=1 Tax=Geodermatophilus ruber TaxID=504800 RepID=A0A1I4KB69_9ACTN|nr:hypothetical protein [Geodermatophilus ruber]SFL75851.1 hypothetical protein SAMN04488085_11727 [Geodermatophilus ruber]
MTAITAAPPAGTPLRIGHGAVLRAIERNTVRVVIPAVGTMHLPPVEDLAWFGGLATLAVVGLVEWPVALAIGAGHLLAHQNHLRLLRDFGQGLEQA